MIFLYAYLVIAAIAAWIELSQDTGGFAADPAFEILDVVTKGLIWPITLWRWTFG